jgi:hypothetical protein
MPEENTRVGGPPYLTFSSATRASRQVTAMNRRRALFATALGFLQLREPPLEVGLLRRWLDTWAGLGAVVGGMNAQGYNVEMCQFPRGWRVNLYPTGTAHSIVVASAWEPTPWRAVQVAAWEAGGAEG